MGRVGALWGRYAGTRNRWILIVERSRKWSQMPSNRSIPSWKGQTRWIRTGGFPRGYGEPHRIHRTLVEASGGARGQSNRSIPSWKGQNRLKRTGASERETHAHARYFKVFEDAWAF